MYRERARSEALPAEFAIVIEEIARFADPVITGDDVTLWRPDVAAWEP